ncbi:cilia- and flagella-associated protein 70-like [Sycon ciliatum]|uniref:cilia- and flagella-associated protein 70-like n=1 Tax=Sycon ciliatum TaxID=27933 RepID=UPI0031F67E8A
MMAMQQSKTLHFNLKSLSNLKTSRTPTWLIVRIEHADVPLKSTQKVEYAGGLLELGHAVELECPAGCTVESWIDRLISYPLMFTLLEVASSGKDKRGGGVGGAASKDEKTVTIGQGNVDLLHYLKAVRAAQTNRMSTSVDLIAQAAADAPTGGKSTASSAAAAAAPGSVIGQLAVDVSNDVAFVAELPDTTRVLHVCVDALYAPPMQWTTSTSALQSYAAGVPLPNCLNGTFQTTIFPSGHLSKGQQDPEPSQRTWNSMCTSTDQSVLMDSSAVVALKVDEDDGALNGAAPGDAAFRNRAKRREKVAWFSETRRFLPDRSVEAFYTALRTSPVWPVEVMRVQQAPAVTAPVKGKRLSAAQEDSASSSGESQLSYHGVAFVDLSPLLYPGCTQVRGCYRVFPHNEADVLDRAGRTAGLVKMLQQAQAQSATNSSLTTGTTDRSLKSAAQKRRTSSSTKLSAVPSESADSAEGGAYDEQQTFIKLQFSINRAIVEQRSNIAMEEDILRILPMSFSSTQQEIAATLSGNQSVNNLHKNLDQIAAVVKIKLCDVVRNRLERLQLEDKVSADGEPEEVRSFTGVLGDPKLFRMHQQDLARMLAASGSYDSLQDELRSAVLQIVKEKFVHMTAAQSREELQELLPQVHMFVAREIKKYLAQWKQQSRPVDEPIDPPPGSAYLLFAREAESERHYKLASHYYRKCITANRTAGNLFQYAKFCLACGDQQAARRNLMAAISQEIDHVPSLLLFAILSAMHGDVEQAGLFLEAANEYNKGASTLPRTILGLVHDMSGDIMSREMSFREARRHLRETLRQNAEEMTRTDSEVTVRDSETPGETDSEKANPTIGVTAASSASTSAHVPPPAGAAAASATGGQPIARATAGEASQLQATGSHTSIHSVSKTSQTSLAGEGGHASQSSLAGPAATTSKTTLQASGGKGHTKSTTEPETTALDKNELTEKLPSIFMDVAVFAIACHVPHFGALALQHHLAAHGFSLEYYIVMASLCLERGHYQAGAECLEIALKQTYANATVWAILGHIQYFTGDTEKAKASYDRCINLAEQTKDEHIIKLRLGHLYLEAGEYRKAKTVFLLAAKSKKLSAKAWLGAGKACYYLESYGEAENALREARSLNHEEAEVWAYLSLISLQCGHRLPAERTFQYAMKMGLRDSSLARVLAGLQAEKGFGDPAKVLEF